MERLTSAGKTRRRVRRGNAVLDMALVLPILLSVAFVDLIPEAVTRGGATAGIAALIAYLLVHLTQHTLGRHFHFGEETHAVTRLVSQSALVGLLLHTFVDGVAVASGMYGVGIE